MESNFSGSLTPYALSPSPYTESLFILQDNQTADLIWNYPNQPHPQNPQSSYRRVGCIPDGSCLFHAILKGIAPLYLYSYKVPTEVSEETLQAIENIVSGRVTFPDYIFNFPRNRQMGSSLYRVLSRERYVILMDQFRHELALETRSDFAYKIQNDPRMQGIVRSFLKGSIHRIAQEIVFNQIPDLQKRMIETKNGHLPEDIIESYPQITEQASQKTFRNLIRELLSGEAVSPDFLVLLSEYTNFDFYLLRDVDLMNNDFRKKRVPLYGGDKLHRFVLGPQDMRPLHDPQKSSPNRPAIIIISITDNHYELIGRVDIDSEGKRDFKVNFDQAEPIIRTLYMMLLHLRQESEIS